MKWLVSYVRKAWNHLRPSHIVPMPEQVLTTDATCPKKPKTKKAKETKTHQQEEGDSAEKTPKERESKWKCLLCDGKPYKDRSSARGMFKKNFPCPQCVRDCQADPTVISGAVHWSDHTERMHHKFCSPFITEESLRDNDSVPKAPRQRKAAKRKRDEPSEELAPFSGVFELNLSEPETEEEENPSKKARVMEPVLAQQPVLSPPPCDVVMDPLEFEADICNSYIDLDDWDSVDFATCPSLMSSASSDSGGASDIFALNSASPDSNTPPSVLSADVDKWQGCIDPARLDGTAKEPEPSFGMSGQMDEGGLDFMGFDTSNEEVRWDEMVF